MKHDKYKKSGGGKVRSGAPSGFVISIIFHAVAFFLAGVFVVFTVLPKEEPEFVPPPPIERPKMKLKKPKVKVKKSSSPKPSSRIVAKVKTAKMPEIQIPDLVGTGTGLLGGTGLGDDFLVNMPNISDVNVFGQNVSAGKDLEVSFYCLARRKDGKKNSMMTHQKYYEIIRKFVRDGWRTTIFSPYYRSPKTLYASCVAVPLVNSMVGPICFGEEDYALNSRCWAVHYQGKLVHRDGITFRFWGASDDVLTVALNKKVVFAANFGWDNVDAYLIADDWNDRAPGSQTPGSDLSGSYFLGNETMTGSGWITLEPGEVYDFDAVAGEGPGGLFFGVLLVEIQGEDYPLNKFGQPIFPLFATEPLTWEAEDAILMNLRRGAANVTNLTTFFITE